MRCELSGNGVMSYLPSCQVGCRASPYPARASSLLHWSCSFILLLFASAGSGRPLMVVQTLTYSLSALCSRDCLISLHCQQLSHSNHVDNLSIFLQSRFSFRPPPCAPSLNPFSFGPFRALAGRRWWGRGAPELMMERSPSAVGDWPGRRAVSAQSKPPPMQLQR